MSHPHEQRVGTESQQSGEIKVVTVGLAASSRNVIHVVNHWNLGT